MAHSEQCPVCCGKGIVPNGFYSFPGGEWLSTSLEPETCRSCRGKGYIVIDDVPQEKDYKKIEDTLK